MFEIGKALRARISILKRATIFHLLATGSPSAIPRFVVAVGVRIAVNAVVFAWFWSHVSIERGKRLDPLRADSDATASPVLVVCRLGIETACFHSVPGLIFRKMRQAMCDVSWRAFGKFASTTTGMVVSKAANLNDLCISTGALAEIIDALALRAWNIFGVRIRKNGESVVGLSDFVAGLRT